MAELAAPRQEEVLITRGAPAAEARAIQRRAKAGELVPIAEGVYLTTDRKAHAAIVRRNWIRILDAAPDFSARLGLEKEFTKLDGLIGALLTTHAEGKLKTKEAKLVAKGTPVDQERMERFAILASRLRTDPMPRRAAIATEE